MAVAISATVRTSLKYAVILVENYSVSVQCGGGVVGRLMVWCGVARGLQNLQANKSRRSEKCIRFEFYAILNAKRTTDAINKSDLEFFDAPNVHRPGEKKRETWRRRTNRMLIGVCFRNAIGTTCMVISGRLCADPSPPAMPAVTRAVCCLQPKKKFFFDKTPLFLFHSIRRLVEKFQKPSKPRKNLVPKKAKSTALCLLWFVSLLFREWFLFCRVVSFRTVPLHSDVDCTWHFNWCFFFHPKTVRSSTNRYPWQFEAIVMIHLFLAQNTKFVTRNCEHFVSKRLAIESARIIPTFRCVETLHKKQLQFGRISKS